MGQTKSEIAIHIEDARERLGSNLHELENKVKSVTDWRHHFQRNPSTLLGLAFGGGVLLALLASPRDRVGAHRFASHEGLPSRQKESLDPWNKVKGALLSLAVARFTSYVNDKIPGFEDHYHRLDERN